LGAIIAGSPSSQTAQRSLPENDSGGLLLFNRQKEDGMRAVLRITLADLHAQLGMPNNFRIVTVRESDRQQALDVVIEQGLPNEPSCGDMVRFGWEAKEELGDWLQRNTE
jgi:hypothetical protein